MSMENPFPFKLCAAMSVAAESRTPVIERTAYDSCTVEFITAGRGFLEINGFNYEIGPDSVYILHKGSDHRYWPDRKDPWQKLFFVIDEELSDYLFRVYRLNQVYTIPEAPQLRKYFEMMLRLNHNVENIHQQAAVVFHQFVEACARAIYQEKRQIPPEIDALKKHLDSKLEDSFLLENYSRQSGFSAAHLIKEFRHYYQHTPYSYLMARKIELAQRLLLYSDFSIKEIAERLCFSDQYYFSNYFKNKTGLSPSQYKKIN